ncbi:hypothetical protein CSKR_109785 [Clonorchis sinensis]|uniref:Uncharacterized protein n=1 Tax=Clonorchis sinensis TaxID=79923 RepID=A0A419QDD5_CLOSI|nr:hypothetical protein CSKR_109785 [Clonorchis sinensis]
MLEDWMTLVSFSGNACLLSFKNEGNFTYTFQVHKVLGQYVGDLTMVASLINGELINKRKSRHPSRILLLVGKLFESSPYTLTHPQPSGMDYVDPILDNELHQHQSSVSLALHFDGAKYMLEDWMTLVSFSGNACLLSFKNEGNFTYTFQVHKVLGQYVGDLTMVASLINGELINKRKSRHPSRILLLVGKLFESSPYTLTHPQVGAHKQRMMITSS